MSGFPGSILGSLVWAKLGPLLAILFALSITACGVEYWMIKSSNAEIKNLQNEVESVRSSLKGAEDAAFNISNQYEILKEYLTKLNKNIVDVNGNIDEQEFKDLLNAVGGKKKQ